MKFSAVSQVDTLIGMVNGQLIKTHINDAGVADYLDISGFSCFLFWHIDLLGAKQAIVISVLLELIHQLMKRISSGLPKVVNIAS